LGQEQGPELSQEHGLEWNQEQGQEQSQDLGQGQRLEQGRVSGLEQDQEKSQAQGHEQGQVQTQDQGEEFPQGYPGWPKAGIQVKGQKAKVKGQNDGRSRKLNVEKELARDEGRRTLSLLLMTGASCYV
jgi:hypothetical protein